MDYQSIIIVLVLIFFICLAAYKIDQAQNPKIKGIETKEERLKKKEEERLKQEEKKKLYDEIRNKQSKIYEKLRTDYKKWESTIDLKEKEKIWSQLTVQQELYDKLTNLRANDSDYIEKANLYLKDK